MSIRLLCDHFEGDNIKGCEGLNLVPILFINYYFIRLFGYWVTIWMMGKKTNGKKGNLHTNIIFYVLGYLVIGLLCDNLDVGPSRKKRS